MTTQQLWLFNGLYLVILIAVAFLTRATRRRIVGALSGGVVALGIIAGCEKAGWWHMAMPWEPYFVALLWMDFALCAWVFLLTWRIARRFGGRGLAVLVAIVAVLGPVRDSWYMARFPQWGSTRRGLRRCWRSRGRMCSWELWGTG